MKAIVLLAGSAVIAVSIQAPAFAFAQGLSISNSNTEANIQAFPEIADYGLQFLYRDTTYERVAGQDASLVYGYFPLNSSRLPLYLLVGVSNSMSNLHNWEISLIAWRIAQGLPPLVEQIESTDIQLTENPRIIARYLVFEDQSNYTYVIVYWYQRAMFKTGLTVEPRYVRINLLFLTKNQNDAPALKEALQVMGQAIAMYWEPLKVQSLFSLGIPAQQFLLGSTMFAAIVIQSSQYTIERKKKKTNLTVFENFASGNEKVLYHALIELNQKTKETTTKNVALALEKATGRAWKIGELIEMLNNLEKHGIVKTVIINVNDQPIFVWKP